MSDTSEGFDEQPQSGPSNYSEDRRELMGLIKRSNQSQDKMTKMWQTQATGISKLTDVMEAFSIAQLGRRTTSTRATTTTTKASATPITGVQATPIVIDLKKSEDYLSIISSESKKQSSALSNILDVLSKTTMGTQPAQPDTTGDLTSTTVKSKNLLETIDLDIKELIKVIKAKPMGGGEEGGGAGGAISRGLKTVAKGAGAALSAVGGLPAVAIAGGAIAGGAAAYKTGKHQAEAADLGFRPSGTPGSVDEAGNVTSYYNPETKETVTALEMRDRLIKAQPQIDAAEAEKATRATGTGGTPSATTGPPQPVGTGIGDVSAKYESGGRGVGTISTGVGDAGGVSYGTHQLSSNAGTMQSFVNSPENAKFKDQFAGLTPGTPAFNQAYSKIASSESGQDFASAQKDFITRTHYQPVAAAAKQAGIDTSNPAIQQALFSQSVQHGFKGNQEIIDSVAKSGVDMKDSDAVIKQIYKSRGEYASQFAGPTATTERYKKEQQDVLASNARFKQQGQPTQTAETTPPPSATIQPTVTTPIEPTVKTPIQPTVTTPIQPTVTTPIPPSTTMATTTPPASKLAIGDSIAQGIATDSKTSTDLTKIGASPSAVLANITKADPATIKGKDITLSTGASNNPAQLALVEQQVKALKNAGAGNIKIMGVGDRPDFAGVNDKLADISKKTGATFSGPLDPATLGPDRVHPTGKGYAAINAKENIPPTAATTQPPEATTTPPVQTTQNVPPSATTSRILSPAEAAHQDQLMQTTAQSTTSTKLMPDVSAAQPPPSLFNPPGAGPTIAAAPIQPVSATQLPPPTIQTPTKTTSRVLSPDEAAHQDQLMQTTQPPSLFNPPGAGSTITTAPVQPVSIAPLDGGGITPPTETPRGAAVQPQHYLPPEPAAPPPAAPTAAAPAAPVPQAANKSGGMDMDMIPMYIGENGIVYVNGGALT
jgi:hypothetical protein